MNPLAIHAETIKERVTFREVAERYGLEFNRAGAAICPFHAEKTPSFKIKNEYGHCFGGCGWNGDLFDFTIKLFGLSFSAALEKLNDDFALNLHIGRRMTLREQRDAEQRLRKITEQRERDAAERKAYEERYNALYDEYERLNRNSTLYAPQNMDEEWHPLFCEALRRLPEVQFEIDTLL
jgi:DNA primase